MKTKRLLRNSNILSSALLVAMLLGANFYANADENLLLSNILLKSIDKNVANSRSDNLPIYQTNRWLATSPSVQLSYLRSQEELGAEEIELGINWSIKSSMQRKIDDKLKALNNTIITHQKNLTKLYFSGLIRESLWSYKLAEANLQFMQKKLNVLNQLASNSRALVEAGESSDYGLLLIQKELNITRIAILASNQEMQNWQTQYQTVTGESELPTQFNESIFDAKQWPVSRHPSIQYKEDNWKQLKLIAQTNSNDSSPWSVGLTTKNTESQGFSDKQIGISIEVPLTMIRVNSQSIKNQSIQNKKQFETQYQAAYLEIEKKLVIHLNQANFLVSKKKLLKDSVDLSQKIMQQLDSLKAQSELGQELILRRVIDELTTRHEYALTNLLIQQNNAMTRQSAGISL